MRAAGGLFLELCTSMQSLPDLAGAGPSYGWTFLLMEERPGALLSYCKTPNKKKSTTGTLGGEWAWTWARRPNRIIRMWGWTLWEATVPMPTDAKDGASVEVHFPLPSFPSR